MNKYNDVDLSTPTLILVQNINLTSTITLLQLAVGHERELEVIVELGGCLLLPLDPGSSCRLAQCAQTRSVSYFGVWFVTFNEVVTNISPENCRRNSEL